VIAAGERSLLVAGRRGIACREVRIASGFRAVLRTLRRAVGPRIHLIWWALCGAQYLARVIRGPAARPEPGRNGFSIQYVIRLKIS
jgi:hypothetical protein